MNLLIHDRPGLSAHDHQRPRRTRPHFSRSNAVEAQDRGSRSIHPVLADNCIACHVSDSVPYEARLRQLTRERAIARSRMLVNEVIAGLLEAP